MSQRIFMLLGLTWSITSCMHIPYPDETSTNTNFVKTSPQASAIPFKNMPRNEITIQQSPWQKNSNSYESKFGDETLFFRVDNNIWRTSLSAPLVFNIMSRVILQRYTLAALDKKNYTLTTEWDKFFIEGRLFRNKITLNIFALSPRTTEIVLRNNVEFYSGKLDAKESQQESAWLPAPDITDEIARILEQSRWHILAAINEKTNRR